jgi:hypothetical protein
MFLVSKIKVIPYYANRSTPAAPLPLVAPLPVVAPSLASPTSPLVSLSTKPTPTNNTISDTEFHDKVAVLGRNMLRSIGDAERRVVGDDLLMDDLCDKIKSSLNLIDTVGDRRLYSSRQL